MSGEDRPKRSEPLFTLDQPTIEILKHLEEGPNIVFSGRGLAKVTKRAESKMRSSMSRLKKEFIDRFQLRLKQEHRNEIFMRLMQVLMRSTDPETLREFEAFLRTIPNISEIYRIGATDVDYVLNVNAKAFDDHDKVRGQIVGHEDVKDVRPMVIERPVATPHTEISFLYSNL